MIPTGGVAAAGTQIGETVADHANFVCQLLNMRLFRVVAT